MENCCKERTELNVNVNFFKASRTIMEVQSLWGNVAIQIECWQSGVYQTAGE